MKAILLALALVSCAVADDVVELTAANFKSRVLDSNEVWLVEFFAPWCGHCKSLAPEWAKAATALKGIVNLGAVDMTVHQQVGQPYGIQGFPTIKVFGVDKSKPTDYQGARSANAIVDGALDAAKSAAHARLGGRGGSSGGSRGGSGSGSGSGGHGGKDEVIELTESNFEKLVLQSDDLWLVEFFAPWCGHCKTLAPEWAKAAGQLKGEAKLGAVDATVHASLASRYGVQGYPTIKVFPSGKKSGDGEDYQGARSASGIVDFAKEKLAENVAPPEVVELTGPAALEACTGKQICFVSFLSHISESKAAGRNTAVKLLQTTAYNFRKRPFGFLWAQAGDQPELERALDVGGFGYPAMVAVNAKKKKYAILRGAFAEKSITEFVGGLLGGKQATFSLVELPTVHAVPAWDGNDVAEEVFEDIDLSSLDDVSLDDGQKTEL